QSSNVVAVSLPMSTSKIVNYLRKDDIYTSFATTRMEVIQYFCDVADSVGARIDFATIVVARLNPLPSPALNINLPSNTINAIRTHKDQIAVYMLNTLELSLATLGTSIILVFGGEFIALGAAAIAAVVAIIDLYFLL
ncbi:15168_t:CDS:2, partial [Dentiscutata erythropus]